MLDYWLRGIGESLERNRLQDHARGFRAKRTAGSKPQPYALGLVANPPDSFRIARHPAGIAGKGH